MLIQKFKEVLYSVLPITIIVLVLNFTLTPMEAELIIRFIISSVLVIFGLTLFLVGVDISIIPIGNSIGSTIIKSNKIWIIVIIGLIIGFFISFAEPNLQIFAKQIELVTSGIISKSNVVMIVSLGIASMFCVGPIRIIYNFPFRKLLLITYGIIFIIALFTSPEFLAISFDASASTTGVLVIPIILAFATGVSKLKKDSKASEKDSFGLVAIASTGAIMSVMIMSIISKTDKVTGTLNNIELVSTPTSIIGPFIQKLPAIIGEVIVAITPIIVIFLIFQKFSLKLSRSAVRKILFGLLFTFVGLTMFLLGVNASFIMVGNIVGYKLASIDNHMYVILLGFILGMVTILAEPTVNVLTHQIEDVTSGSVKRKDVMIALALGEALAVTLSIVRILIPEIQLWCYLLPGYIIAIVMAYFVPELFVGIAFDSGQVVSGPMTVTFILAFTQGAAEAIESANVLVDGFGVVATIAMTPLIVTLILGFIFKLKSKKGGINNFE